MYLEGASARGAGSGDGGVAITSAMLVALAASFSAFGQYAAFFVGAVILATTGLLDDLGEVSAGTKMLVQIFAAVLMTSGGANFLINLGNLFATDPINTRLWGIPLTVFATVAVINAINMFDGLDGFGRQPRACHAGVLRDVCACHRRSQRGEDHYRAGRCSGRLSIFQSALAFAWRASHLHGRRRRHGAWLRYRVVLGFADSAKYEHCSDANDAVGVRNSLDGRLHGDCEALARRRSLMSPDREIHIHHILMRCGYSPRAVLVLLVAANALMAAVGTAYGGWTFPIGGSFGSFLAVCAAYFAFFHAVQAVSITCARDR